jgi:hypothetical protein
MKLTKINGKWVAAGNDPFPPEPDRDRTDPTAQDRRINPKVATTRKDDGSFYVQDVLRDGGHTTLHLSAFCRHCNRTLAVIANAPGDMPKYAKDEACRLALLHHWRTDHVNKGSVLNIHTRPSSLLPEPKPGKEQL